MIEIISIRINLEGNFMWVDYREDGEFKEACLWQVVPEDGMVQENGAIYQNPGNYFDFPGQSWNSIAAISNAVKARLEQIVG